MRNLRPRDIRPVLQIQRLAGVSRRQELADAVTHEEQCAAEAKAAELEAEAAFRDWQACLAGHRFDPDALAALGERLTSCDVQLQQRRFEEARARDRTNEARTRLAEAEAQISQTEKLLKRLQRQQRRHQEDRRQYALEDRISYDWVAR